MKKGFGLLLLPNITYAGGSGLAHLDPGFWILILIIALVLLGLFIYLIYYLSTIGSKPSRNQWNKDRDKITELLIGYGYQMIFSDMESGVIHYKNKKQPIEINKYQNQWFIKAEKQELQSKDIFKAHQNVGDLNESLLKFID